MGVFVVLVVMTLFAIVFERKVVSRMQQRTGPNRVGPRGYLQSLADGLKLAFKEDIMPALADKPIYFLAPVLATTPRSTGAMSRSFWTSSCRSSVLRGSAGTWTSWPGCGAAAARPPGCSCT